MAFSENDKTVLSELAKRYREIAELPVMAERKILWRDLRDLKPQRPMILFEPYSVEGYLSDYTFRCENPLARSVETKMMMEIRQFDQLHDDIVLEPYFRLGWQGADFSSFRSSGTDFGDIKIVEYKAEDGGMAYKSGFPVKTPDDIKRMTPRSFKVGRERILGAQAELMDAFGDALPVIVGNYDNFDPDLGCQPFTGNFFVGITFDVFKLIGADALMLWPYDNPDAIAELVQFLVDDKKRFFKYLLDEGLLCSNTDNQFAGPSSYGYTSELPTKKEGVQLKDLWGWADSQETQMISPAMFDEFYLPAIAEISNLFGKLYYGCCERVDQKLQVILKALPTIRSISVSGWTDVDSAADQMGANYVMSKKPYPAFVSTATADWDSVKQDAKRTAEAVKRNNTPIEVIYRDAYNPVITPSRIIEWIRVWKEAIGIA
jgi:hypothetical protein